MSNIVGIDLGTTFSALAVLNSIGRPEIVPNADGERITASAVFFPPDEVGKVLVGGEAVNSIHLDVSRSARWIKRHMGESVFPDNIIGREWSPAELSSFILKKLKEDCSKQIGVISDAVITVPAYFDEVRRKATMEAGTMAGLNVVGIVNEPTAAALFYAVTQEVSGRILVFDLGGGTFDVTIMDVKGKEINIVCALGDHQLGGYDFDQKIVGRFDDAYRSKYGVSLYSSKEDRARYETKAEDAKRSLSKRSTFKELLAGPSGNLQFEISREQFEADISPFIAKIEMLIETALDEANNKPSDIHKVLLVGGSSRIPIIQSRLTKMFGFAPTNAVNVDECVALGAALHAGLKVMESAPSKVSASIAAGLNDVKLKDVCGHAYGTIISVYDENTQRRGLKNDVIIHKNTPLPCEFEKTYYTIAAGQESINARITQGDSADPEFINVLYEESMRLPSGRPEGRPIKIKYGYDSNERMSCVFHDVESNARLTVDFDAKTGESNKTVEEAKAALENFTVE